MAIAAAAAFVVGVVPLVASAAPGPMPASTPTTSADALQQFNALSKQASLLNEDLEAAQVDLQQKQAQLAKANVSLTTAKSAEQKAESTEKQFQGQVDQFAAASFDGARLNQLSALLTGTSAQDFLTRATLLNEIAQSNNSAMTQLSGAVTAATDAQHQAADAQQQSQAATAAAAALVKQIQAKQQALNAQIAQVQAALNKLTTQQRTSLSGDAIQGGTFLASNAEANTVIQAALSRRGDEYVWGAAGPTTFDCSGLVLWSYAKIGVSLPHSSREMYTFGKSVPYGQWQPGDLLFFGSSASTIHHVAMYVGNGDIVQALMTGTPVEVTPISGAGNDYYGAKRLLG